VAARRPVRPVDPGLGETVRACFAAAETALIRSGAPAALRHTVSRFAERYAERGRCPAHDQMDALRHCAPAVIQEGSR
jgi:hypothetical protein